MKSVLNPCLVILAIALLVSCKKEKINLPPTVNAGINRSVTINFGQKDTIMLSGSATDKDGQVTGFEWSQISGPNNAVIENDGAASTAVSGIISGTYVFQLLAVDNSGNSAVASVTIITDVKAPVTLTLQPANNSEEVIIYGYPNGSIDLTNNVWVENCAGTWTNGGSPINLRSCFKFDFSSIPASATIISAKLTLYSNPTPQNGDLVHANSGSDNGFNIQRITTAWTGAAVTYANQPTATTEDQVTVASTLLPFLDVSDVDVTALVQSMIQPNANNGFLMRLQNETAYNIRNFCSSKYSDSSKHPKLVIQYTE